MRKDIKFELDPDLRERLDYTKMLIHCWVESWGGPDQVYVAFSGGKDSTALLHIVRSLYPTVPGVFCNTGLEFPEIVQFVKQHENIEILHPRIPFHKVIEKYGWPVVNKKVAAAIHRYRRTKNPAVAEYRLHGRVVEGKKHTIGVIPKKWHYLIVAPFGISEKCCDYLKKEPMVKYVKRTGRHPMIGIMAKDSNLRARQLSKQGCNFYDEKDPKSNPLAHWSEEEVWLYLKEFNVPYCKIYDMGYNRTGCTFCMFGLQQEIKNHNTNRFLLLKKTHPKLYDYCINKLGAGRVLDYMKIDY